MSYILELIIFTTIDNDSLQIQNMNGNLFSLFFCRNSTFKLVKCSYSVTFPQIFSVEPRDTCFFVTKFGFDYPLRNMRPDLEKVVDHPQAEN